MSHPSHRQLQKGFTLIELMVALAMGLMIVLALITMLINVSRNNNEMSKTNRVIENGRFALQLLESDIVHAGYWGGYVPEFDNLMLSTVPTDVPTAVPDPCLAFASWTAAHKTNLLGVSVQGYEIPATVPSPTLSVCASIVTNPQAKTDVLLVRHAETCLAGTGNCAAANSADLNFQMNRCGTTANLTPAYVLSNDATTLTLQKRNCLVANPNEYRRFISSLYYVRNFSVTSGDGIPTLMRSQYGQVAGVLQHKTAEAMIEGVEGFRVEYGVDNLGDSGAAVDFTSVINWASVTSPTNRGDGTPDGSYVRCTTAIPCTVAQLMNTVAVKVYVLIRSENTTAGYTDSKVYCLSSSGCPAGESPSRTLGPFGDGYKRHLFTQTVRLNNISARRETP